MMRGFLRLFPLEFKLALRNPDLLLFGLGFPVGIMVLIGLVSSPETTRLGFGGVGAVGIAATGLMGLPLTISDYRHRRVLTRFRASPADPAALLLAQGLTQLCVALISAALVWLSAALLFGVRVEGGVLRYILAFLVAAAPVYTLGCLVASLAPDMKTANAAASLLYFPMLLLAGTTVPTEIMPKGLRFLAEILPLGQGVRLLKSAVLGTPLVDDLPRILALLVFSILGYSVAATSFRWD